MPVYSPTSVPANWPGNGPCSPWATPPELCCPDIVVDQPAPCGATVPAPVTDPWAPAQYLAMASEVLFGATAGLWPGECTQALEWQRTAKCNPDQQCSCNPLARIDLGALYPIGAIIRVAELADDGTWSVVDQAKYRLDDYGSLVRLDGLDWIACRTRVEIVFGRPVPEVCRRAAAELACELMRMCKSQAQSCLPRGAVSMTANGTQVNIQAVRDAFGRGELPLPFCQQCIGLSRANWFSTTVISPDLDQFDAVTWAP